MYLYTCKIITNTPTAKHAKLHFEKRQERKIPFGKFIYQPSAINNWMIFFSNIYKMETSRCQIKIT